jgi:serine/threonine protein kinase
MTRSTSSDMFSFERKLLLLSAASTDQSSETCCSVRGSSNKNILGGQGDSTTAKYETSRDCMVDSPNFPNIWVKVTPKEAIRFLWLGINFIFNTLHRRRLKRAVKHLQQKLAEGRNLRDIGPICEDIVEKFANQVGNYMLTTLLGQGAFGLVFAARDETCKNEVAMKVLDKKTMSSKDLRDVKCEVCLLRNHSQHPGIIQLREVLHTSRYIYIAMERASCRLDALIKHTPHMAVQPDFYQNVMTGVLEPLEHLHKSGIAHLDIKPGNVLVIVTEVDRIESSNIRLADFGLSKVSKHYDFCNPSRDLSYDDAAVMQRGERGGTKKYYAPELVTQRQWECRIADMWSVGCTLLEIYHGFPMKWGIGYNTMAESASTRGVEKCLEDARSFNPESEGGTLLHDLLFEHLLVINPKKRASSTSALAHAWFEHGC